jgi:hypothetical protein
MFGFMKNAHDHRGYIHALDLLLPFIAVTCVSPTYMRSLVLVSGAMIPRVFAALKALRHIETASEECVTQRQHLLASTPQKPLDMLQGFFEIMHKRNGKKGDFGLVEVKMKAYGALYVPPHTITQKNPMSTKTYQLPASQAQTPPPQP